MGGRSARPRHRTVARAVVRCPVSARGPISGLSRILRGRGEVSRRLIPASFGLTLLPLSPAWPLGGLPRAAPVPFRASSFTFPLHPGNATAQRLIASLYKRWSFPLIPSQCFVAHPPRLRGGEPARRRTQRVFPRGLPTPSAPCGRPSRQCGGGAKTQGQNCWGVEAPQSL